MVISVLPELVRWRGRQPTKTPRQQANFRAPSARNPCSLASWCLGGLSVFPQTMRLSFAREWAVLGEDGSDIGPAVADLRDVHAPEPLGALDVTLAAHRLVEETRRIRGEHPQHRLAAAALAQAL